MKRRRFTLLTAVVILGALHAPVAGAQEDAFSVMQRYGNFGTFCDLVERAGLVERLRATGPITVFAPGDRAFERLSDDRRAILSDPNRLPELRALILYHMADGKLTAFDLKSEEPRESLEGKQVKLVDMGGFLLINDAYIDTADIRASNGLIHAIDKVLTPPG
jgi:uncharacterized surface protein with fasciclin (FAS1) repeats